MSELESEAMEAEFGTVAGWTEEAVRALGPRVRHPGRLPGQRQRGGAALAGRPARRSRRGPGCSTPARASVGRPGGWPPSAGVRPVCAEPMAAAVRAGRRLFGLPSVVAVGQQLPFADGVVRRRVVPRRPVHDVGQGGRARRAAPGARRRRPARPAGVRRRRAPAAAAAGGQRVPVGGRGAPGCSPGRVPGRGDRGRRPGDSPRSGRSAPTPSRRRSSAGTAATRPVQQAQESPAGSAGCSGRRAAPWLAVATSAPRAEMATSARWSACARRRRRHRGGAGRAEHRVGAGAARLRAGDGFVVLDADARPGGAWQHRWPSLTVGATHRVHDLPGLPFAPAPRRARPPRSCPRTSPTTSGRFDLPVHRPVAGRGRPRTDGRPVPGRAPTAGTGRRGPWSTPPAPGPARSCRATRARRCSRPPAAHRRLPRPRASSPGSTWSWSAAARRRSSCSARSREVTATTWVTRRPPVWRDGAFDEDAGRAAWPWWTHAVRAGLPPGSVVGVTGLLVTAARSATPAARRPGPAADVRPDHPGRASPGTTAGRRRPTSSSGPPASAPRSTTWRRCTCASPAAASGWTAPASSREPRLHLVGYGPSASTIGANRAGPRAVRELLRTLDAQAAA